MMTRDNLGGHERINIAGTLSTEDGIRTGCQDFTHLGLVKYCDSKCMRDFQRRWHALNKLP